MNSVAILPVKYFCGEKTGFVTGKNGKIGKKM